MRSAILSSPIYTLAICFLLMATACHHLDDTRIPPAPVHLVFANESDWNIYGVAGAGDYKSYIRDKRIPRDYPYTASSFTGFGGLLLVCDYLGNPLAYDLACPVECSSSIIVSVDPESRLAECPKCHSTYDVFSLNGHPLSGMAAERGYGLRRYRVGRSQLEYMLVSY